MCITDIINSILAGLSLILAGISVWTVVCTIKQNKEILQQNQLMIEEQSRPILAVYPVNDLSTKIGYIIIRNCGASQAMIKSIESDYNLRGKYYAENENDYLMMAIGSVIAPDRNIHCLVDSHKIEKPIKITITYESSSGKSYKESTTIDFNSGIVMPDANSNDDERDVCRKIEHHLAVIKGIMEDKHHKDF